MLYDVVQLQKRRNHCEDNLGAPVWQNKRHALPIQQRTQVEIMELSKIKKYDIIKNPYFGIKDVMDKNHII